MISEKKALALGLVIRKIKQELKDYNGHKIEVIGIADCEVRYKNQICRLPLAVVKGDRNALFGLNWLRHIKLDWIEIGQCFEIQEECDYSLENTLSDFKHIFEKSVGIVKNMKDTLDLKDDTILKFCAQDQFPML